MADIEQWVNLTVNDKWKDNGLTERARMGERVTLEIRFAEEARARAYVTKEADAGNAVYSRREKGKRLGFRAREYERRRIVTNSRGVATLRDRVNLAGGDSFTFTVEDRDGNTVQSDTIKTRRKFYFQVIKMDGVAPPSAADITFFKDAFWDDGNNLYIKMVEITQGETITSLVNFDDTVNSVNRRVIREVRQKYDNSKRPYAFVILFVNKNCIHRWERAAQRGNVQFNGTYTMSSNNRLLFDIADPAEEYFGYIMWKRGSGAWRRIPKNKVVRVGDNQIEIDTTGLPQNVNVRIKWKLKVVAFEGMGFSSPDNNFTCVATQSAHGVAALINEIKGTINHEVGHKIGMVPGRQGSRALDSQAHYYDGRGHFGGHCYHGSALERNFSRRASVATPDCVMFGDTRVHTAASAAPFCPECLESLRKMDLRSRTNRGVRTQF